MTEPGEQAEALVEECGIFAPGELDVEALALMHGMRVQRAELDGCAATLVGYGDRAVATIRPAPGRGSRPLLIPMPFDGYIKVCRLARHLTPAPRRKVHLIRISTIGEALPWQVWKDPTP